MEHSIAIITGANRGIGKETARALAFRNYTVIMACRNIEQAEKVCEEIKTQSGNENVFVYKLDLTSFASVVEFVKTFSENFDKVNILINNAGITTQEYEITADGFEKTLQTNSISPYMLTKMLSPLFPENEDNRIINLSSAIYPYGRFEINQLNNYHWVKAYAVSKYTQLLISLKLSEELKNKGITVNAVHPGVVRTNIMLTGKWYDRIINSLLAPMYIDKKKGAEPNIYLATSPEVIGITGKYYKRLKQQKISNKFLDNSAASRLYSYYESIYDLKISRLL